MNKEIQNLLRNRAIDMAKEPNLIDESSSVINLIIFSLSTETYGIQSDFVREVFSMKDFTALPGLPTYILGIINVRGQILPVINLKKLFNISEIGFGELNKVIILKHEQMEFGILADVVLGNKSIDPALIQEIPPTVADTGVEYLRGVTSENLIVFDAERLLKDKTLVINDSLINS